MYFIKFITLIIISLTFISCDASLKTSSNPNSTYSGFLIDTKASNIYYETSSDIMGLTNGNGEFRYKENDTITFYLDESKTLTFGNRNIVAKEFLTTLDLTFSSFASFNYNSRNLLKLLIAYDNDHNIYNGITINSGNYNPDLYLSDNELDDFAHNNINSFTSGEYIVKYFSNNCEFQEYTFTLSFYSDFSFGNIKNYFTTYYFEGVNSFSAFELYTINSNMQYNNSIPFIKGDFGLNRLTGEFYIDENCYGLISGFKATY
jgi:hypothetical protein